MNTSLKSFVDTNIFLNTLFETDKKRQKACIALFKKAEKGEISLWTTEWVVAELIWFYHKYNITWDRTSDVIKNVLTTKGLEVRNSKRILSIVDRCNTHNEFIDGINVVLADIEGIEIGYSYDKGIAKWGKLKRLEP